MKKDNKGFSLVELLVVIAIMVVLVGVIAPSLLGNIEKSRESRDIQTLDSIAAAVQQAIADEKGYELGVGITDAEISTLLNETNAFNKLVKEYMGNVTAAPNLASQEARKGKIYVTVDSSARVTVAVKTGTASSLTVVKAPKSNIDLSVTR